MKSVLDTKVHFREIGERKADIEIEKGQNRKKRNKQQEMVTVLKCQTTNIKHHIPTQGRTIGSAQRVE